MPSGLTPGSHEVPHEWWEAFEANAKRSLETRMRYAFIHTYKPVLDDAPYRAFETMDAYRRRSEERRVGKECRL